MKAPIAQKIDKKLEMHGDTRIDPYFWMNERENPSVLQYLEEENAYADAVMKDTESLQEILFEEMKARYKKDDESLPYFFNEYWFYVRYEEEKEYPIFCRKHFSLDNNEEIVLDVNTLAENEDFMDVGSVSISPDNKIAAFSMDKVGRRIYSIHFRNLETGEILEDEITNTTGKLVWTAENQHVFYIRKDKSLRAFQVYRHQLGQNSKEDSLVFHEEDETFDVGISKTKSLDYIIISSSSTISDEHRFIPSNSPYANWKIIQPRIDDLEYAVEHYKNDFYIITNADDATNFKIVRTPIDECGMENWIDFISHRNEFLLEGFEIFKDYFIVEERNNGLLQINILNLEKNTSHYLPFAEPTYTTYIGVNLEFNTNVLRFGYTSLTQPSSTFEYNMESKTATLLKQQEVLGGNFYKENYISERIWAPSRDSETLIPISLVYHKNTQKNAETPLLLYGYGSMDIL